MDVPHLSAILSLAESVVDAVGDAIKPSTDEAAVVEALNVHGHIGLMKPLIQSRDWSGLESQCELRCRIWAGETAARRISRVSMVRYQSTLVNKLSRAVARARTLGAKAVYFEFDMDYDWGSWFFVCPEYPKHWDRLLGRDYLEEIKGPEQHSFTKILGSFPEAYTPREATMESYLIARTFASFGRTSEQVTGSCITLGMAFHDQGEIIRLCEGNESA